MMSDTGNQIFFEGLYGLLSPYRLGDDTRPLQLAFAKLFDDAAHAVFLAGSDLDEILIERLAIIHHQEKDVEVALDFLSDPGLLMESVADQLGSDTQELAISTLKIVARHDKL